MRRHYIEAARSLGATSDRLDRRATSLPNVASPLIIQVALALGYAMLTEAGLSFLGLGEQPPTPSWGGDAAEGLPVHQFRAVGAHLPRGRHLL